MPSKLRTVGDEIKKDIYGMIGRGYRCTVYGSLDGREAHEVGFTLRRPGGGIAGCSHMLDQWTMAGMRKLADFTIAAYRAAGLSNRCEIE